MPTKITQEERILEPPTPDIIKKVDEIV